MLDIKKLIAKMLGWIAQHADFVVEQGTSGDWTYRKWNSGKAEAWGKYNTSSTKTGLQWVTNLYYSDEPISFPNGVFVAGPIVTVFSNNSQWTAYAMWSVSSSGLTVRFTKPNSSANTINADIHAIGRWK